MDFLSHSISAQGICPHIIRIEAVRTFPVTSNKKSLHHFVGFVNYFHCYVPQCAEILAPLCQALAAAIFAWNEQCHQAFDLAKQTLSNSVMLALPQPNAPTCITADASNFAVDAVLEQRVEEQWKPISFFSKKRNSSELNYRAFDRELLAACLAVRPSQYIVEERPFHISTDHKPHIFALQSKTERRSPRQARHLAFIFEFTSDIRHIDGHANHVADALSRNVYALTQAPVELETMACAHVCDPELKQLPSTTTSLQNVPIPNSDQTILCDVSQGYRRPVVPSSL